MANDLASAMTQLRKAAGLSRHQLEAVSGVSEETVKAIEYRRNTRPTAETLKKLAIGLATNRALGRLDQGAADEIVTTLMQAAGYLPVAASQADEAPSELPSDILAKVEAICATDEELLRDVLSDVDAYPPEERSGALEFALQSLRALRGARREPANHT